jgi:high-affinity iron transporter
VTWADSVPNLLIGLREGLEAGLVVTILLAAVRKATPSGGAGGEEAGKEEAGKTASTAPIWLGVLGAVTLSGAFAAVLTFSVSVLSSRGQEAVGGLLSVFAVGLVTAMIFWMRRTAKTLSAHLRGEVARAAAIGAGALTVTAFLSVGREGLETTLFLWTAARASGQTAAPLAGAAVGIAVAVALCWLLYRRAVHLNVGVFFNRTALALIVIAAGVLAYGLGDLQDAGLLPGQAWIAFDLTPHIDPGSWWASIITGVTELAPKMTVLQVTAWLAYLVVVIPAFVSVGRSPAAAAQAAPAPAAPAQAAPAQVAPAQVAPAQGRRGILRAPLGALSIPRPVAPASAEPASAEPAVSKGGPRQPRGTRAHDGWARLAGSRPWAVAGVLIAVPALAAGVTIAALPADASSAAAAVTVTKTDCAPEWTSATSGTHTFTVANQSGLAGEINLDDASGAVVGEIETIGPGTSAQLTATLGTGTYTFKCLMGSRPVTASQPVTVTTQAADTSRGANQDPDPAGTPVAVKPVTAAALTPPNAKYQAYAAAQLTQLAHDVATIETDLRHGHIAQAKRDWLPAQLDWERVGASYDSFGDLGLAVDGLPDGLPNGVSDKDFTGLHRLEYGLWHGQSAGQLLAVAETLAKNVATVQRNLTSDDLTGDPTQLPIRAHEIIEDALRDHLSGIDDEGGGAAFAQTYADTQVDRVVLGYLAPLLNARQKGLVATADSELSTLQQALLATRNQDGQWLSLTTASLSQRQHVDAATGQLLETLAAVPDLLEVPPAH